MPLFASELENIEVLRPNAALARYIQRRETLPGSRTRYGHTPATSDPQARCTGS